MQKPAFPQHLTESAKRKADSMQRACQLTDTQTAGYAVVGMRVKNGKKERFRTPRNLNQWYRHPVAERMLRVLSAAHPSWSWRIEIETNKQPMP